LSDSSFPWEILVIDDQSSDDTPGIVKGFAQSEPRVRLLVRAGQRGLAGVIAHGWTHTDADLLGFIDADLQHSPNCCQPSSATSLTARAPEILIFVVDLPCGDSSTSASQR